MSGHASTDTASDGLDLELVIPACIRSGETVQLTLRVVNPSERGIDLYLRGRSITFDVEIARTNGEVVWRLLADEIIPAIVHLRTLGAGERIEARATLDQKERGRDLEPGDYRARGLLLLETASLETPWRPLRVEVP